VESRDEDKAAEDEALSRASLRAAKKREIDEGCLLVALSTSIAR